MGDVDSETISIYVLIFKSGSYEALLRFITLLNKIVNYHILTTVPQMYEMTKNLLAGEVGWVFEQQARIIGKYNTGKYKLAIMGLAIQLFPPKTPQHQKRYLHRGLFNPWYSKI